MARVPFPIAALSLAPAFVIALAGAGCQAVVDFDEALICADERGQALDCTSGSRVPDDVALECVIATCNRDVGRCEYPPDPDANGQPCTNPDPCVTDPTCQDGRCVGTAAPVGEVCDANPCNPGTCEPAPMSGGQMVTRCVRVPGAPGTECTPTSVCQTTPATCRSVPNEEVPTCVGTPQNDFQECEDDGDPCTVNSCFNGDCLASPVNCPAGEVCDPDTGDCVPA